MLGSRLVIRPAAAAALHSSTRWAKVSSSTAEPEASDKQTLNVRGRFCGCSPAGAAAVPGGRFCEGSSTAAAAAGAIAAFPAAAASVSAGPGATAAFSTGGTAGPSATAGTGATARKGAPPPAAPLDGGRAASAEEGARAAGAEEGGASSPRALVSLPIFMTNFSWPRFWPSMSAKAGCNVTAESNMKMEP